VIDLLAAAMDQPTLREIAPNVFGYIQPDGSWGLSNAGLVVGNEGTLLVDTLFDYAHTRRMLDAMSKVSERAKAIDVVVNTHANGDHCYGNALLRGSRIISSEATKQEMLDMPPKKLAALMALAKGLVALGPARVPLRAVMRSLRLRKAVNLIDAAPYVNRGLGKYQFRGIELVAPNETFNDRLSVTLGGRTVELMKVGPAHTLGDVIAYVRDARVVFSGDILFSGHHPLIWSGTVSSHMAACERVLALDFDIVVPGHGPYMDRAGVLGQIEYFRSLLQEVRLLVAEDVPEREAVRRLVKRGFGARGLIERLAVNVNAAYRELQGHANPNDAISMFAEMARVAAPDRV
jgi:cyclase